MSCISTFSQNIMPLPHFARRCTKQVLQRCALSSAASRRSERLQPAPPPIAPRASPAAIKNSTRLPVLPLVALFCLGSASFYFLAKSRAGHTPAHTYELPDRAPPSKDQWPTTPPRAGTK